MAEAGSTLIAHVDTNLVTREQLAAIPAVVGTDSFKPVAHIELIQGLEKVLGDRDIRITREQYAIGKEGWKMFATLDLSLNGIQGSCASLGIRTANNRTMALQMVAGLRIFVCDNMAFNGDMIALKRRHTSGLSLVDELEVAVDKYEQHYFSLKQEVDVLRERALTDTDAKCMIHDIFARKIMPVRFLPEVSGEYFAPAEKQRHPEFAPRTAWSLHNAFTEVAKGMPLTTRMDAVQQVGKFFGLVSKTAN